MDPFSVFAQYPNEAFPLPQRQSTDYYGRYLRYVVGRGARRRCVGLNLGRCWLDALHINYQHAARARASHQSYRICCSPRRQRHRSICRGGRGRLNGHRSRDYCASRLNASDCLRLRRRCASSGHSLDRSIGVVGGQWRRSAHNCDRRGTWHDRP